MTPRAYTIVDVFTDTPLQGNPAAVFTDGAGLDDDLMQRTARELNLSETVFVLPPTEADADAAIRIFTPGVELPFAGHPVLGTAFVVGRSSEADVITLETKAGLVPIRLRREQEDGRPVYGEMDQPLPTREPFEDEDELLAALNLGRSELPIETYCNGPFHTYVTLPDEASVAALQPDFGRLLALGPKVQVNCFAGADGRFKTRNFSAALGVPEDPATGSAAGPLAVHLARHGRIAYGQEIEIRQGEEIGRPSLLRARVDGSEAELTRVTVGGSAVIVAEGEYHLQ